MKEDALLAVCHHFSLNFGGGDCMLSCLDVSMGDCAFVPCRVEALAMTRKKA